MKVKIIIAFAAIVIAVVFGAMTFLESNVEYGSFKTAMANHKKIQVKGEWVKNKETSFDASKGQFIFYMKDDNADEMKVIYDGVVDWADIVIVATPLRWGNACSLYYEMVQRMNCIQNQIPSEDRYLIQNKVAAFIITGGQDGVQHVAGEMLMFWSELGFVFGRFPFVGWSRGWYAEDTENNYKALKEWKPRYQNATPYSDTENLVDNAVDMATLLKTRKLKTSYSNFQSKDTALV